MPCAPENPLATAGRILPCLTVRHDGANGVKFVNAQTTTGRAPYRHHGLDPDLLQTNIVSVEL